MAERKKHPGGRPRKDTPEIMDRVLNGIKAGLSYEGACGLARVHYTTFLRWKKEGESSESGKYYEFYKELQNAEAIAEAEQLKRIKNDPDTKYACWILERRFPDRWGKKDHLKQEITGESGGPIKFVTFAEHRRNDETDA